MRWWKCVQHRKGVVVSKWVNYYHEVTRMTASIPWSMINPSPSVICVFTNYYFLTYIIFIYNFIVLLPPPSAELLTKARGEGGWRGVGSATLPHCQFPVCYLTECEKKLDSSPISPFHYPVLDLHQCFFPPTQTLYYSQEPEFICWWLRIACSAVS